MTPPLALHYSAIQWQVGQRATLTLVWQTCTPPTSPSPIAQQIHRSALIFDHPDLKRVRHLLRKDGSESRSDGTLVSNPCRMGPLTLEARRWALTRVLDIQDRAGVDLINSEEQARILHLIAENTWPQRWTGTEPRADLPFENVNPDGSVQPLLLR